MVLWLDLNNDNYRNFYKDCGYTTIRLLYIKFIYVFKKEIVLEEELCLKKGNVNIAEMMS